MNGDLDLSPKFIDYSIRAIHFVFGWKFSFDYRRRLLKTHVFFLKSERNIFFWHCLPFLYVHLDSPIVFI